MLSTPFYSESRGVSTKKLRAVSSAILCRKRSRLIIPQSFKISKGVSDAFNDLPYRFRSCMRHDFCSTSRWDMEDEYCESKDVGDITMRTMKITEGGPKTFHYEFEETRNGKTTKNADTRVCDGREYRNERSSSYT